MNRNTIIRTVILFVALLNQVLTMSGKNPLPFSEGEIYELLTMVITAGASITAWWKNNSFTEEAQKADEYLKELKK